MIEQILEADRHLQVDQIEKARDMYGRVVELDPGNAIAVVGLARCALADGDDPGAYELASRALEIDPQNDMARRMEARLSEILAARGEAVERAHAPSPSTTPTRTENGPAAGSTAASHPPAESRPTPPSASTPKPAAAPRPATTPYPPRRKERPMRKSLFDRLMGR